MSSMKRSIPTIYLVAISFSLVVQARHEYGHSLLDERKITQQDRTFYKYVTRPDIDAPVFHLDVHDEDAVAPGYWFVAPYGQLGQDRPGQQWDGPHIYDETAELVWSGTPMFGYWNAFDFESSIVKGERMLTLLSDHEKHGFILDSSYEIYRTIPLLHGQNTHPNMHDFNVLDDESRALMLTHVNRPATKEASKWSASTENAMQSGKGSEKWTWSLQAQMNHLNSNGKFPDGDYLLSARHTDAVYKISHIDGSIVWRLGGVKSDLQQNDWQFSRQHHAQVLEQNDTHTTLNVFDNGIGDGPFEHATSKKARALILSLDTTQMKADIVSVYKQPKGERTDARGSFQVLPNGNRFICWAYNSYITEHAPNGSLVMEASIPIKLRSYRAFKHPWVGTPSRSPDIHAEAATIDDKLITVIHVSWNGDTRTKNWVFGAVDEDDNVQELGSIRRQGFETRFEYQKFAARVFAEARDGHGNRLGKSGVTTTLAQLPLTEGASSSGHIEAVNHELAPLSQGSQVHGHKDPVLQSPVSTFAIGITCGIIVAAVAWTGVRVYNKRRDFVLQKGSIAKYMPLQDAEN